ncbi:MAG: DUF1697 domain-containing protein [Ignavibacteriales bacterium]|nr:DUF1697 domain-containing protein [Ignavibacteriales bacterium]
MPHYIALLRGINFSGHKIIKMAELKELLMSIGFGMFKHISRAEMWCLNQMILLYQIWNCPLCPEFPGSMVLMWR